MLNILTPLVKMWRKPVKIDTDSFTAIEAGQWVNQTSQSGNTATVVNTIGDTQPANPKMSFSRYSVSDYESHDIAGVERLTVIEGPGTIFEVDSVGFALADNQGSPADFVYAIGADVQVAYNLGTAANEIAAADVGKLQPWLATNKVVGRVEYHDTANGLLYVKLA